MRSRVSIVTADDSCLVVDVRWSWAGITHSVVVESVSYRGDEYLPTAIELRQIAATIEATL
jgi:hypothetical protein